MAATTKLTTKNQKDKMIGLTPNGAFYMFPGMDYSTLGNGVLEMPMTPPNPAMGTEFKNQIVTNQQGQNLFPGLMTYVKGDKYQQYKHAEYGGYGDPSYDPTSVNSGVSGSESASDVQTTLATWAKLNNLDYDKVVEQFSALDNKEQMQAYTSIKAKLRQQELQSMMTPSMGMTDTSMQVAKDGGCIDCQEQFPQAQNLNWFYGKGGLKKFQTASQVDVNSPQFKKYVEDYNLTQSEIQAILNGSTSSQFTGKTPEQIKNEGMSIKIPQVLGKYQSLDDNCQGPYCATFATMAFHETFPDIAPSPLTGGDNYRDLLAADPRFGLTSTEMFKNVRPGSIFQEQSPEVYYIDPVTKETRERSKPSWQSGHNMYVYDIKELPNGMKRMYTIQNPGFSNEQVLKEYDIDEKNNVYSKDNYDYPIMSSSNTLESGDYRPLLMYRKEGAWSDPRMNDLLSRRSELMSQIKEVDPFYFEPKKPTRYDVNEQGVSNYRSDQFELAPNVMSEGVIPAGQMGYLTGARTSSPDMIDVSKSKLSEMLERANNPEFKKKIMTDYNISNDEFNEIIKTAIGQYGMESQFDTWYGREPNFLSEIQGDTRNLFVLPPLRDSSIGPFQIKYNALTDKTKKYIGEDSKRNIRRTLKDPEKAFDVAVRYLAEQVPQLRNYSRKEGERQNMTPENYMQYLPYMISQQGWVRNTDAKNMQRDEPSILGEGRNAYIEGIRNYGNQLLNFFPSSASELPVVRMTGGEAFPQANTYPLTWAGYSGTQYASGGEAFPQAQTYLPYDRKGETRPNFMFKEGGDQFGGQFDPSMIYNVMKRGGLNLNPKKKRGGSLSGMEFKDYLMKNGGLLKFQDDNSQPGVSGFDSRLAGTADDPRPMGTSRDFVFEGEDSDGTFRYYDRYKNIPNVSISPYAYLKSRNISDIPEDPYEQAKLAESLQKSGDDPGRYQRQKTLNNYDLEDANQRVPDNSFTPTVATTFVTNTGTTANAGTTSTQSTATNTGTTGTGTTTSTQSGTPTTTTTTTGTQSGTSGAGTSGSDNKQTTSPYTNFDYAKYANLIKNQQVAAGIGAHIRKNPLLNALTMPYHAFNVGQQTVQGVTRGARAVGNLANNIGRIPSMIMAKGGMPSLPYFQTDGGVGGGNASNPSNPDAACECKDENGNVTKNMKPCSDGTCPSCDGDGSCPEPLGYNHVGAQQAIGSLSAIGNFVQDINAGKQQRKDEKLSAFNTLNIAQPQQNTSQMMGKALVNTTQGNLNQPNMFAQVQKPGLSMQSTSLQEGTMPKSWMNPNSPLQPINARIGGTMFESGGEYDLDIDTVRELIKAGWDVELI